MPTYDETVPPKGTVLIVDDTRTNIRLLTSVLEEAGYAVRVAFNGSMALESVQLKHPDLILLDIMMPGMSGYEVCMALKADTETQNIPVIFLTALSEVMDKVTAFSVGGVDYITKPFYSEEVLARVNTHLALHRSQQELTHKNEQLEYEIAERRQVAQLLEESEKRYRSLFEDSPISLWEQNFVSLKWYIEGLHVKGITDLEAYFSEHPQHLRECVSLIKIVDVNQVTLTLYQAQDKRDLINHFQKTLTDDAVLQLQDCLIAFDEGQTVFIDEAVHRTLAGEEIDCVIKLSIAPGYEETWRKVFVSVIDITDRKEVENAFMEAHDSLTRRIGELLTLNHITQTLATVTKLAPALEYITELITKLFQAFSTQIMRVNTLQTECELVAKHIARTLADSTWQSVITVSENPLVRELLLTKQTITITHAQSDPLTAPFHPMMRQRRIHNLMAVPLIARGRILGLLEVQRDQADNPFTHDEIKLAETIAGQIASAIDNAQLFEDEQRQREVAESLREVATVLVGSLDQEMILSKIVDQLGRVIRHDGAGIFLRRENSLVLTGGAINPIHLGRSFPLDERSLILRPYSLRETVIIPDVRADSDWEVWSDGQYIASWMGAPMLAGDEVLGVLTADSNQQNGYDEHDAQILQTFANQAAIAIRNAQLYQQIQRQNADLAQTLGTLQATQDELVQSEKMAVLGQLVSSIAHELNTPLGTIQAAIGNISQALDDSMNALPELLLRLDTPTRTAFFGLLNRTTANTGSLTAREERKLRRRLQRHLAEYDLPQADLYADLLSDIGVYDNIEPILPLMRPANGPEIMKILYRLVRQKRNSQNILTAVERASKIVFALKSYARFDRSKNKHLVDISETVETVLTIYQNQFRRGITLTRRYADDLPKVLCYPNELNQAWTNLIHNALQAMDGHGQLEVEISRAMLNSAQPSVVVAIIDSGHGISEEVLPHIFEPFFTTRAKGEGTGLGLDIVRRIVDKHAGKIEVDSQPGRTTFRTFLPLNETA